MESQITHATNIRECCSSELQSIDITGTLLEAAQKMVYKRVGALAVLRQRSLVGVITEADLVCAMAEGSSATTTVVEEYMTADPITVAVADDAGLAARRMVEHGIGHLPVVDAGSPIGMVSRGDLLALGVVPMPRPLVVQPPGIAKTAMISAEAQRASSTSVGAMERSQRDGACDG
jgi:predicted transcriptional regulator